MKMQGVTAMAGARNGDVACGEACRKPLSAVLEDTQRDLETAEENLMTIESALVGCTSPSMDGPGCPLPSAAYVPGVMDEADHAEKQAAAIRARTHRILEILAGHNRGKEPVEVPCSNRR